MYLIGEREAELEVAVETLILKEGGKDRALLYVVKEIFTAAKVRFWFVGTMSTCTESRRV